MAVTNIHAGIELRSFPPGSDLKLLDACQRRFETVICSRAGRANLHRLNPENFFERGAMLVAARRGAATIGVAHYHPTPTGMSIGGLAVDSGARGNRLGSAMVALGLTHGRAVFGDAASVEGVVRENAAGLDEWGCRMYRRLGFRAEEVSMMQYLSGTYRDRHLFSSAEEDEQGAVFVRYRRMVAYPACYERARDFLARWSQAILRIAPRRQCC